MKANTIKKTVNDFLKNKVISPHIIYGGDDNDINRDKVDKPTSD